MGAVLIYELALNGKAQGNPFSFKVCVISSYIASNRCSLTLAGREPHARSVAKCSHQCRREVPAMHEERSRSSTNDLLRMYVPAQYQVRTALTP